jgi:transposase
MKTEPTAHPKLYIGIDMHKRSWKVHCATDLFIGKSFSMPPEPKVLYDYVQKNFAGHEVSTAYEAGCCGFTAHRSFVEFGWRSVVANPADIHRRGKEKYSKTDRIDAQLIARELKDDRLNSIKVPDVEREELRSLFRRRNDIVKDIRRNKSRIKMQLLYFGITIPQEFEKDKWSHKFRNWVDQVTFAHPTAKSALEGRMRTFRFLDKEKREISTELRAYCRKHYKTDYNLLRSVPGIGGIVACGILSELGDLRRFGTIKHLAGYLGLAPGIYQSGDNSRNTGITKRANKIMRSYFVEASWQAIRADPVMQDYYRKHLPKDSKTIIIKIARKLASRTLAVIKTGIPYQPGVLQ